jgi:HlyD family secretion protein
MKRPWRHLTRPRPIGVASAGLAAAIVMTAVVVRPDQAGGRRPSALVREAAFTETLVERGTINAARVFSYGSTIVGTQAKILELASEGTAVATNDVLIRFDPGPFEEAVAREAATLAQASAELLRAREDVRLEQAQADTEVEAARQQVGFAQTALANERDGKGPLAIAEAEAAAAEAAREVERAQATAEDMRALIKESFVTRVEVDRAEQSLHQAEDRQRIADLRLKTTRTFERPAALDKSRADVAAAEKGLGTTNDAAESRLAQRHAILALAQSRADEARLRLEHARDQLERTTVRASTAGLVVYPDLFFGTDKRKPRPGDEVWPSQPLVTVPDPAQLIVETRVREIDLHKIALNQRVTIGVDAYPGLALSAAVTTIGALAQEDAARAGTRFFPVTVRLLDADARLRTGMTARVAIEVASFPKATIVPIQALVDDGGVTECVVLTRLGPRTRVVEVAARSELVAAIRSGVAPGETVLLIDPLDGARPGLRHP